MVKERKEIAWLAAVRNGINCRLFGLVTADPQWNRPICLFKIKYSYFIMLCQFLLYAK